jgi:hypothetical protein
MRKIRKQSTLIPMLVMLLASDVYADLDAWPLFENEALIIVSAKWERWCPFGNRA